MNVQTRPPATAQGTLDQRPLAHLLVYVSDRRLAGSLVLRDASGEFVVVFEDGRPAKIGTPSLPGGAADSPRLEALLGVSGTASFAFYENHDPFAEMPASAIDAWPWVWRSLQRRPPLEHVRSAMTRIANHAVRLADMDVSRFEFQEEPARVISALRHGSVTVRELAVLAGVPVEVTELVVYALLVTKRAVPTNGPTPLPGALPSSPGVTHGTAPSSGNQTSSQRSSSEKPDSQGRNAPASGGGGGGRGSARGGGVSTSRPAPRRDSSPATSVSLPPRSNRVAPRPSLPPNLTARFKEVQERADKIDGEDYFQMLGVSRVATTEDIERAYVELVKVWHPDRLHPKLADVRDDCARVFARLSEAHRTLVDAELRERYMRLLNEGGATPKDQETIAQAVEAATEFQKAEFYLKRGDAMQSDAHASRALLLDPEQADYHALAAWLQAMKAPQEELVQKAAIATLTKAIAMNEKCERAYYYRGMLYKRTGSSHLAVKDFQRAADLNPRNVDALREVRLHEMRSSKPPSARTKTDPGAAGQPAEPPRGLLGRLFKK